MEDQDFPYLYFRPDSRTPIPSKYKPKHVTNIFPFGTQCLCRRTGEVSEIAINYEDQPKFYRKRQDEGPSIFPELKTYALLEGIRIRLMPSLLFK